MEDSRDMCRTQVGQSTSNQTSEGDWLAFQQIQSLICHARGDLQITGVVETEIDLHFRRCARVDFLSKFSLLRKVRLTRD